MKILAGIPVEKITRPGSFSFRHETLEVEVIRVCRYPATSNRSLNRWHYQADIKRHPKMDPEAICVGPDGAYRVNIQRRGLNPKWVPPAFPDGKNVFEVPEVS